MTAYERSKTNMFDLILKYGHKNYPKLSLHIPFVAVFADFESLVNDLSYWYRKQSARVKGISKAKMRRRTELETSAFLLCSSLYGCARSNGLTELERRTKIGLYLFQRADAQKLTGMCHSLLLDATAHIALLAPYLIDAAWLTAFEAKIDAFAGMIDAPANARADIREATVQVKRLVKAADDCLRLNLDPLMTYFATADSTLYGIYTNCRKTIRPSFEKPALKGKVTDTEGKPLKGLQVTIAGKPSRKSITTALGNFHFKRLADGKYTLIVKEKKKEVARQVVEVPTDGEVEIVVES